MPTTMTAIKIKITVQLHKQKQMLPTVIILWQQNLLILLLKRGKKRIVSNSANSALASVQKFASARSVYKGEVDATFVQID